MSAPLPLGLTNYRVPVNAVVQGGFRSGFSREHYGYEGLPVSAEDRDHLRKILLKSFV